MCPHVLPLPGTSVQSLTGTTVRTHCVRALQPDRGDLRNRDDLRGYHNGFGRCSLAFHEIRTIACGRLRDELDVRYVGHGFILVYTSDVAYPLLHATDASLLDHARGTGRGNAALAD